MSTIDVFAFADFLERIDVCHKASVSEEMHSNGLSHLSDRSRVELLERLSQLYSQRTLVASGHYTEVCGIMC